MHFRGNDELVPDAAFFNPFADEFLRSPILTVEQGKVRVSQSRVPNGKCDLLMIGGVDKVPLMKQVSAPSHAKVGIRVAHAKVKVRVEKLERVCLVHGAHAILLPFVPNAQSSEA